MLNIKNLNYKIKDDLQLFMEAEKIDIETLAKEIKIAKNTIYEIINKDIIRKDTLEKIYNYIYKYNYRFNNVKEELLKENNKLILFHGSKSGLDNLIYNGSRENCDFGKGFYLGETFKHALSFVADNNDSSIYSFRLDIKDLNIVTFSTDINWMLAICYFRGKLDKYKNKRIIKDIIEKVNNADIIIAPIADNHMFHIMSQFVNGDINIDIALHSLSASSLGKQYIIKTSRALNKLTPIEKYYVCNLERNESIQESFKRGNEIDTKIKMSKREYRNGLFIEEILK